MEECGTGGASIGILSVGTDTFYYGMGRLAGTNDTDPGAGTGAALADVEAAGKSADKGSDGTTSPCIRDCEIWYEDSFVVGGSDHSHHFMYCLRTTTIGDAEPCGKSGNR